MKLKTLEYMKLKTIYINICDCVEYIIQKVIREYIILNRKLTEERYVVRDKSFNFIQGVPENMRYTDSFTSVNKFGLPQI